MPSGESPLTKFVVLLCGLLTGTAELHAEVPAAPPGYASEGEIKQAYASGKLRVIDLAIDVPSSVSVVRNIEYAKAGEKSLQLDLYAPKDHSGPVPAVILIHGGGWKGGYRQMYHYYCTKLAEHGYVAATISYRLSNEAPYPAAFEDVKSAVRWLRANATKYNVNPERIAAVGGSAGGHLALLVAYASDTAGSKRTGDNHDVSSRVQAVVSLYGPTDLTAETARSKREVVSFLGGKTIDEQPEVYEEASPIKQVSKDDPPTLLLHGSIDTTVPIEQSEMLVEALKKNGVPCEYDRVEGWPHAMDLERDVNQHCLMRIFEFLDKHLKKDKS
jgi:acetyl esterase/lipase